MKSGGRLIKLLNVASDGPSDGPRFVQCHDHGRPRPLLLLLLGRGHAWEAGPLPLRAVVLVGVDAGVAGGRGDVGAPGPAGPHHVW